MNPSDETLGAYVDGELDAPTRAAVEAAMTMDANIAQRVRRLRVARERLSTAFNSTLDEPVPQRLINALRPCAEVVDITRARAAKQNVVRNRWASREWLAIAASVIVGALLTYLWLRIPGPGIQLTPHGRLLARADLADALSTQLASEQSRDTSVRIGVSFRDKQGDYCRTFTLQRGRDLGGLACREGRYWQVQVLARREPAPGGSGGAEPAGSGLPAAVLSAVEERITGEPLDASGEAAARQSNWGAH